MLFGFLNKLLSSHDNPKDRPCAHKYKDFPWYLESLYTYDSNHYNLKVTAPYVCVKCGRRLDKTIFEMNKARTSFEESCRIYDYFGEKYKDKIEDRAIVNAMIADYQLVDREYIDLLESIQRPAPSTQEG